MQYGNVSSFRFVALTDDDKISIPDLSDKLDQLLVYLQNWNNYDENTKSDIHNSFHSFVSAAGYYFIQQGSSYWHDYNNRNELFKFLTIYADAVYHLGVCYAFIRSNAALTICEDAYVIFPPEHRERAEFSAKIKEFLASNPVNLVEPLDINDSCDYLLKNIKKYLI